MSLEEQFRGGFRIFERGVTEIPKLSMNRCTDAFITGQTQEAQKGGKVEKAGKQITREMRQLE